jgi:preprotein translocase subunit SecE
MAVDKKAIPAGARGVSRGGKLGSIARFFREVGAELRKVAWPDREEVVKLTLVVLIAIIAFALYVFVLDIALVSLTKPLFKGITQ